MSVALEEHVADLQRQRCAGEIRARERSQRLRALHVCHEGLEGIVGKG